MVVPPVYLSMEIYHIMDLATSSSYKKGTQLTASLATAHLRPSAALPQYHTNAKHTQLELSCSLVVTT
jgi:hypothetical protein